MVFDFLLEAHTACYKGEFDLSTRHKDQLFQGHRYLYLWLPSEFKASLGLHVIFFQEKKIFFHLLFFVSSHLITKWIWYISSSSNPGS